MSTQIEPTTFFKALSDPTRLKLLLILQNQGSQCVCVLTDTLKQPQPTVSRHLNHLKGFGLLTSEKRGTWMWYTINEDMPTWCKQSIECIPC